MTARPDPPPLGAVLIARDEARALRWTLPAVAAVTRLLHLHDTGSADGTVAVARAAGATISSAPWPDDFAAARNAALAGAAQAWGSLPAWVLSVDADEVIVADVAALAGLLTACDDDTFVVEIDNAGGSDPDDPVAYTSSSPRLFRPDRVHWEGRVHERLVRRDGAAVRATHVPREVLTIRHDGYDDRRRRAAKCARNYALAAADLADPDVLASPARHARALLDAARSLVGADRRAEAVPLLEELRRDFPASRQALYATDLLARLKLGAGEDAAVLELVGDMRRRGARTDYCAWLECQALVQLGYVDQAVRLLAVVDEVVDTAGRRYGDARVREMRNLFRQLQAALAA
jgi:hypothetical protein